MKKVGIICPSEIALRRFMPAIQQVKDIEFAGIGICDADEIFAGGQLSQDGIKKIIDKEYEKAAAFTAAYGGRIFGSYSEVASSEDIDILYIPLPPALHFKWAKYALDHGKHILVEKPFTTSEKDTRELVQTAECNGLAVHENYMFIFHEQIKAIDELIKSGEIGDVRLYRIAFGFPRRTDDDFRYNRELGGGALLDAGGYTIKYAAYLLGNTARIRYAQMNHTEDHEVDMYGSAAMVNDSGQTVQLSFGMDNNYKCELEIWGSKGCLTTGRILTAPAGFSPEAIIRKDNADEIRELPGDDAFSKSIKCFLNCIDDEEARSENYTAILSQARLVEEFYEAAGRY